MKIVRKEDKPGIELGVLSQGECFQFDGKIYIKITGITLQYHEEDVNCFCFTTNKLDYIPIFALVTPLNMELREV
jgi:hypothetical protein